MTKQSAMTPFERALLDATLEEFADIPAREADIPLTFSDRYRRRTEKLMRKTNSGTWHYVNTGWKRAILVAALVALLTLTAMAFPAVRRAVANLFVDDVGTHYEFTIDPEEAAAAPHQIETAYAPTYIPEGYAFETKLASPAFALYLWKFSNEQNITFTQLSMQVALNSGGGINSEGAVMQPYSIDGFEVCRIEMESSLFYVWTKDGYYFELQQSGPVHSDEELTKIFRSIQVSPIDIPSLDETINNVPPGRLILSGGTYVWILLFQAHFYQRFGELVGAGGLLHAAADALQAGNDLVHRHSFDELGHALRVAVAAADEADAFYNAVLHVKQNLAGADAAGSIFILHRNLLLFSWKYRSSLCFPQYTKLFVALQG